MLICIQCSAQAAISRQLRTWRSNVPTYFLSVLNTVCIHVIERKFFLNELYVLPSIFHVL